MSNNDRPSAQPNQRYFADKPFTYIQTYSAGFFDFADDCQMTAEELFCAVEEGISTKHHEATPRNIGALPNIFYLELETVAVYYQVRKDTVAIGDLYCRAKNYFYEPTHDLMAGFEE